MTANVYASHVFANNEKTILVREFDPIRPAGEFRHSIWKGGPLAENDVPRSYSFGSKRDEGVDLPDFFFNGEDILVSQRFASTLEKHGLGNRTLFPICIYAFDKKRIMREDFFVLRVECVGSGLVPEKSEGVFENEHRPGFFINSFDHGGGGIAATYATIALRNDVSIGADIWIDERLRNALFVSADLGAALIQENLAECMMLSACVSV